MTEDKGQNSIALPSQNCIPVQYGIIIVNASLANLHVHLPTVDFTHFVASLKPFCFCPDELLLLFMGNRKTLYHIPNYNQYSCQVSEMVQSFSDKLCQDRNQKE